MNEPKENRQVNTDNLPLFLATCPDEATDQTLSEIFDENHPSENS